RELSGRLRDEDVTDHVCPRCESLLSRGKLPDRDAEVEQCPTCGGLWMSAAELDRAVGGDANLDLPPAQQELVAETDPQLRDKAHTRLQDIAAGLLALPNLFIRSFLTLTLLYGLLGLALISAVMFGKLNEYLALGIGLGVAVLQFAL